MQISKELFDILSGKMVNLYEIHVTFQDIEYQLLKNILHHFRHYNFYEIFIKSSIHSNLFTGRFCDIA